MTDTGTTRRRSSGTATRRSDGTLGRVTALADCGCCPACLPIDGAGILRYGGSHGGPISGGGPTFPDIYSTQPKCHRLFVWERRAHALGAWSGANAADWIVKTNGAGQRVIGGIESGPFETTPASGILLDAEPYWWPCWGGWQTVGSMWYQPTLTQVLALSTWVPTDGSTYSILALVRYNHWIRTIANGGGTLIAVTDGQVQLMGMQVVTY